jgi:hypothetical protein
MHLINLSYLPPYLSVPTILYEKQSVDTSVFLPAMHARTCTYYPYMSSEWLSAV